MTTAQRAAVFVLLFLGLLGVVWVARGRVAVERSNRTVALCLDDLEVRQLAAMQGKDPAELMNEFRVAGVTHLAVSEQTLGQLLQTGQLQIDPAGPPYVPEGAVRLRSWDWRLMERVNRAIRRVPAAKTQGAASMTLQYARAHPEKSGYSTATVPSAVLGMQYLGLGYDQAVLDGVKQAGLSVIARPMPDYLYTPQAVEASLQTAREAGTRLVLFNGVSVAGGTKLARQTAEIMNRLGLKFGYVELVPQEGAPALASALKYQIIRTHSISQEEMTKTSPTRGLDRFTLAVTERNIRLCYIRLLLQPQPDLLKANVDYIASISGALHESGYNAGEPVPFPQHAVSRPALVLLALGLVGGGLWFLQLVLVLPRRCFWILLVLGVLVALGGSFAASGLTRTFVSLLSAIIFPALGVLYAAHRASSPCGLKKPLPNWLRALGLTVTAVVLTAFGGLLIAGALSSSDYMMQISQFRGVKLAQLLPLVIVLAVSLGVNYQSSGARGWVGLREGWCTAAEAFVKYWHAIAIFVGLGAVGFMLMRSGNESAVEVSGLELKLRALLDQILIVRPRTKEIILGYPALLMGLTLLLRGRSRGAWVWLTIGTIGVLSATNTFCHLHTPLLVSLLRTLNGIWVGLLVGIGWWVAKAIAEKVLNRLWWTNNA